MLLPSGGADTSAREADSSRNLKAVCPPAAEAADRMEAALLAHEGIEELAIDHARLFVGPFALLAPPYGSVYLEGERRLMGDSTLAVGECYREVGLEVAAGFNGTPDHIAAELEFMHFLVVKELEALAGGDLVRAQHFRQKQKLFFREASGRLGACFHAECRGAGANKVLPGSGGGHADVYRERLRPVPGRRAGFGQRQRIRLTNLLESARKTTMKPFHELLETSAVAHGHLCPGQVVGVRMAMLGCRLIGLDEPTRRDQIKKLIVYVEMDRCTADAVAHVTGVKLGRRSLKFVDYGIMAATFLNLATGKAFRVVSTEEARDLAAVYAPGGERQVPAAAHGLLPHAGQRAFQGPAGAGADQTGRSARPDPAQGHLPSAAGRSCATGARWFATADMSAGRARRALIFQTPGRSPGRT